MWAGRYRELEVLKPYTRWKSRDMVILLSVGKYSYIRIAISNALWGSNRDLC